MISLATRLLCIAGLQSAQDGIQPVFMVAVFMVKCRDKIGGFPNHYFTSRDLI